MKTRITHLDGLRGVAAALVLVGHVAELSIPMLGFGLADKILKFVGFGRIGVIAFFCLSGFVIPFSFRPHHPLRSFAVSRFFRLYPAFWLSIAIMAALAAIAGQPFSPAMIAANATMAQSVMGQPDAIGVFWTLFIELLFYVLCVVLFLAHWLERPRRLAALCATFCLLALAGAVSRYFHLPARLPVGIPGFLAIMLFGTVCRHAYLDGEAFARRSINGLLALLGVTILLVAYFGYAHGTPPARPLADFLGMYIGLALFLVSWRAKALFSRPVFVWLGDISYSLYLLHAPVVFACAQVAYRIDSLPARAAVLLLSIALSLLVAAASNRFVERPMIHLGRRLLDRSNRLAPAGA